MVTITFTANLLSLKFRCFWPFHIFHFVVETFQRIHCQNRTQPTSLGFFLGHPTISYAGFLVVNFHLRLYFWEKIYFFPKISILISKTLGIIPRTLVFIPKALGFKWKKKWFSQPYLNLCHDLMTEKHVIECFSTWIAPLILHQHLTDINFELSWIMFNHNLKNLFNALDVFVMILGFNEL